jgi:hypothetical protein
MRLKFRPRAEMLDRRDVPSTVLVDHQSYSLTGGPGPATVTLTVTGQDDGYYLWDYVVRNDNFVEEPTGQPPDIYIGTFNLPVVDAGIVSNLWNSLGWDGYVGGFMDDPADVYWEAGDSHPQIAPGSSGEFKFTTTEVPIGPAAAGVWDPWVIDESYGQVLAPTKGAKVDFANATTGQDYQILIQGYAGPGNKVDQVTVGVTKNANAVDIADSVKLALEGAGYKVTRDGTKLTIAPPAANRTSLWFQTQKPNGQNDNNLKGPSLLTFWSYEVWVNGVKQNP